MKKTIASITIVLIIALLCFVTAGYRHGFIIGRSMEPDFTGGDIVILKQYDGAGVEVGDIVVFRHNGYRVFHRVIYIADEGYVTQGDNTIYIDIGYRTESCIEAVYVYQFKTGEVGFIRKIAEMRADRHAAYN